MTNDEIDKLEGRELDRVFVATLFGTADAPCWIGHDLGAVIAALPDKWVWKVGKRWYVRTEGEKYFGFVGNLTTLDEFRSHGPTPATALCRAAIKAKAAEDSE